MIFLLTTLLCASAQDQHTYRLSSEGKPYQVDMTWTYGEDLLEVEVTAQNVGTASWFAIGFSSSGSMKGAEIQRFSRFEGAEPTITTLQSFDTVTPSEIEGPDPAVLKSWSQDGNELTFKFQRPLASCVDASLDLRQERETWVLYAFGSTSGFHYHGSNREAALLDLRNPVPPVPIPANYEDESIGVYKWTYSVNTEVPAQDTTYIRTAHPVPQGGEGISIVAQELNPGTQFVHHILWYYCDTNWDPHFDNGNPQTGTRVTVEGHESHDMWPGCGTQMWTWAIGGQQTVVWPEKMALKVPTNTLYIVMEIHYDNPTMLQNRVDQTEMNFYWIEGEREQEIGNALVGPVQDSLLIPAGETRFVWKSVIGKACTGQLPHPIHVHQVAPHTHNVGTGFQWRVIRDGEVVHDFEWLYDFDKQSYFKTPNMTIHPGDELEVTCIYNTAHLSEPVHGGESSSQEMCYAVFDYYPMVPTWDGRMFLMNDPVGLAGYNAKDLAGGGGKAMESTKTAWYQCDVLGSGNSHLVQYHEDDTTRSNPLGFPDSGYTHRDEDIPSMPGLLADTAQCRDVLPEGALSSGPGSSDLGDGNPSETEGGMPLALIIGIAAGVVVLLGVAVALKLLWNSKYHGVVHPNSEAPSSPLNPGDLQLGQLSKV